MSPGAWMEVEEVRSATKERWSGLKPFSRANPMPDGAEVWRSADYDVTVRRYEHDPLFGNPKGYVLLGVSRADGTALHDWRDLQAIKNKFVGDESEGIELFPRESRLLDPSNYFMLHCFPGFQIGIGKCEGRRVCEPAQAIAPQRGNATTGCK